VSELDQALDVARALRDEGGSPIPLTTSKRPPAGFEWAPFQSRTATDAELDSWFGNGNPNGYLVGLVTGAISGVVVVDGDNRDGPKPQRGAYELQQRGAFEPPVHFRWTPHGVHVYYEHPGYEVPNSVGERGWLGIRGVDVRGDGGYVVYFGPGYSPGLNGDRSPLPEWARPNGHGHETTTRTDEPWVTKLMRGVAQGERDDACTQLAGYYLGKGVPADIVESILVPWGQRCNPTFPRSDILKVIGSIDKAERAKTDDDDWAPTNLNELRDQPELDRFGLGRMLYRGRVHWLQGDPETGKSFLAYAHAVDEMLAGRVALLLDEDAGASDAESKLRALGSTDEMFADRLVYLRPAGRDLVRDRSRLLAVVEQRRPSIVVVDAAADHLDAAGLNEDKASDVTKFVREALKPLSHRFDVAVVVIDHKTKANPDGRDARGSGAKLAKADVAYNVFAPEPFSRSRSGRIHVVCTKDKAGYIGRDTSWSVHVNVSGGAVALEFGGALTSEETRQMRQMTNSAGVGAAIVAVLDKSGMVPMETGEIVRAVGRARPTVSSALNQLERDGVIVHEKGDRPNQKRWRLL
jgi:hypothetical protein